MSLPVPLRSVALVRGAPHGGHCPGKFVKNQYQFVSDFSFLTASCRKDTVRVKDRCIQVTVERRSYAGEPAVGPPTRLGPNTATLGAARTQPGRRGDLKADSERRPMLGAPLGAGAAHVMQFRPVVIAQPAREGAEQAGEAGQRAPGPAPMAERSTGGGHDLIRAALCPRSFLLLVTAPTATFNALALNIGKTSPRSAAAMIEIRPPPGGGCVCRSLSSVIAGQARG